MQRFSDAPERFLIFPTDDWQSKRDAILNIIKSGDSVVVCSQAHHDKMRECLLQIRLGGVEVLLTDAPLAEPLDLQMIEPGPPLIPDFLRPLTPQEIARSMAVPAELLGPPPIEANCLPPHSVYGPSPLATWLASNSPVAVLQAVGKHFARNESEDIQGAIGPCCPAGERGDAGDPGPTPSDPAFSGPQTGRTAGSDRFWDKLPVPAPPVVQKMSIQHHLSGPSVGEVAGCLEMIGSIEDILSEIRAAVQRGSLHDQRFEGEVHLRLAPAKARQSMAARLGRSPDTPYTENMEKTLRRMTQSALAMRQPRIDPDGIARRFVVAVNFERYKAICQENRWDRLLDARPVLLMRPLPKPDDVIESVWFFDDSARLFSHKDKVEIAKLGMMVPAWFWESSEATIG